MRILMLAENWAPRVGGIENYLANVAEQLSRLKHEVMVVVPPAGQAKTDRGNEEIIRKRFFWPIIRPSWLLLYCWLKRKAKREKVEMVLCGKALFEGLVGYYLNKKLGIPYIIFTYAMEIDTWQESERELKKLQKVLLAARRVVYINDQTKQVLVGLGVSDKQLLKLLPGVRHCYLEPISETEKQRVKKKYQISGSYVLTVARLIPRKGVDDLIEAFSGLDQIKFRDMQLVIVGAGPEREKLEEIVKLQFMENSVRFLEQVPDEDLSGLYAGASLFALTPKKIGADMEGFGIVYLEAAAYGCPAVGTKTGGVPEAVVDGQTGVLVEPSEVGQISQALAGLLSDENRRKRLGKQAQERVRQEFCWQERIKTLEKALTNQL